MAFIVQIESVIMTAILNICDFVKDRIVYSSKRLVVLKDFSFVKVGSDSVFTKTTLVKNPVYRKIVTAIDS